MRKGDRRGLRGRGREASRPIGRTEEEEEEEVSAAV